MTIYKGYLKDKDGNILLPDMARDFLVSDTLTVGKIECKNLWQNSDYLTNIIGNSRYTIEDGGFKFTRGSITGGKYIAKKIQVEKGINYTFSGISSAFGTNNFYICIYRNNVYGQLVKSTIASYLNYTATENEELLFTFIIGSSITNVSVSNIQVEKGMKVTSYYSNFKIPSFDEIYPIGAIYLSINSTNPNKLFGGAWRQIAQGRTLVGVDTSDTDFNIVEKTGGEKNHTLSIEEIPTHTHDFHSARGGDGPITIGQSEGHWNGSYFNIEPTDTSNGTPVYNSNTGGNQSHNNLQPYYTCYIWLRTA